MEWSLSKRSVLVPYDFSDPGAAAFPVARSFVDDPAKITVVHVLERPAENGPGAIWGSIDEHSLRKRATESLRAVLDEHLPGASLRIEFGPPGDVLCEIARELGSDLIVVPSHGRRGFQRWLLGSVAERVVRMAPCPVLVVRRDPDPDD